MPDQLPKSLKQERLHHLAEVESELRHQYFSSLRGARLQVLVESPAESPAIGTTEGRYVGTACRYAPVELTTPAASAGQLVDVVAGPVRDGRIVAER